MTLFCPDSSDSPYILEELPPEARIQVVATSNGKQLAPGVSPEFALTRMDEDIHPEVDVYVEDNEAKILVQEVLAGSEKNLLSRVAVTPFGAASVGKALGQMASNGRFARPSVVFLDADQESATGCCLLPGDDAPERTIFDALAEVEWKDVALRVNRSHADLVDGCQEAINLPAHHDRIRSVADHLTVRGNDLWRATCISYVAYCLDDAEKSHVVTIVKNGVERAA